MGVGLSFVSQLNARMLDDAYKYYKEKNGGKGKPGRAHISFDEG